MKIGVYGVAKNEEQFVKRWFDSVQDADYILVADTGSTDNTRGALKDCGVDVAQISVRPWRFDDARNTALCLMPSDLDIVVSLDMDEILTKGWRAKVEQNWSDTCTRLRYQFITSWTATGEPDVIFYNQRITGRHTHRWRHPIHEILVPTMPETICTCDAVLAEHHPDNSKSRGQYLELLQMAVREDPTGDRCAYYLGREYFFHKMYDEAITEFQRHLALPTAVWKAERASSMRYLGKCHEAKGENKHASHWLVYATIEEETRETLIDAARFLLTQNDYNMVIALCERALLLPAVPGNYMSDRYALAEGPYDLAAVAYFYLGYKAKALEYAQKAAEINPTDPRIKKNLETMA